jgi:hypothetical protein
MIRIMILMVGTPIIFIFNGNYIQAAMKNLIQTTCYAFFCIIINCNTWIKELNESLAIEHLKRTDNKMEIRVSVKDSVVQGKRPTYQEIYSESEKRRKISAEMGADPSTIVKEYNENLDSCKRKLMIYYQQKRIISIVNRISNERNDILANEVFTFDENNNCISNAQRDYKEDRSYIYAMYWDSLIKFDVYCKLIDLTPSQKQQIIKSVKASLDSIMQHFPEFKYSFNWK